MKVGTQNIYTYQKESKTMRADALRAELNDLPQPDPELEQLVVEIIGRVADKWTMLLIETLTERGASRFGELSRACTGISQKMLTQSLRAMERDGLVTRTVYPVVPPKVVYQLTDLGLGLSKAFCAVWIWAEENRAQITQSRADYAARQGE